MPPKKKAVKAPVKKAVKAPAKRPVGRPRKPLGTRVSDVDLLANVGSTKPMPRRIGRDALEQQRARIRYAVDYPGRRFTERMTRALQDSFATGALPYGVSLRAPADFKRPYTTTFEPIAGMPVWPAINVPPNADAEDALRLVDAAQAAAAAVPDPSYRPTKRAKRSVDPGTSGPRVRLNRPLPGDTSEVYVPDTKVADRQQSNVQNAIQMAADAARVRNEELANLRRRLGNERRRRQGLPAILSPDETLVTSFLRANTDEPSRSFSGPTTGAPDREFMKQRLEAILGRLPTPTAPASDDQPTRSRPGPSSRATQLGALSPAEQSQVASALANERARKRPKGLTEDQKRSAKYLSALLSNVRGPPPTPIPPTISVPTLVVPPPPTAADRDLEREFRYALMDRLREIDDQLSRPRAGRSNAGLKRERESIIEELQKEAELASIQTPAQSSLPQQVVVSVPDPVAVNTELQDLESRAIELQDELSRPRSGKSKASTRRELENVRGAIQEVKREVAAVTPSSEPAAPVRTRLVMSDDTRNEIERLQGRIAMANSVLSRPMSSAQAAEYGDLRDARSSDISRLQELMRARTISEPATAPQSIVVPGTEAPDSQQETIMSQYAIEIGRLNQRILDLQRQLGNDDAQKEQAVRGMRAAEEELEKQIQKLKAEKSALNVKLYVATAPSVEDLRKEAPTATVVSPEELAAIESFVMATIKSKEGLRPGTVDAYMKSGKKIDIEARSKQFQRQLDALNRAKSQIEDPTTTPSELRSTAKLPDVGESARERLLDEAERRDQNVLILREPRAPRVPTITPAQLAMVSREIETDRAPADTAQIPPPSNPPEPSSQDGPATGSVNGSGLQHVTAATFPSSKWTTASSLRWLRSNGLHPIRKSTKINGSYSYALQSPTGYSSFNSVKMSHKNKDFTIVYGTPK